MLKGALAAAVTPLRDGGEALDEDVVAPYVEYLAEGGLDGILALGTTGEGILLREDERRRAAELFVAAAPDGFDVAVRRPRPRRLRSLNMRPRSARPRLRSSGRRTTRSTNAR
jgi:hypothetical protein